MESAKNGFLTKMQAQLEAIIEEGKNFDQEDVSVYQAIKNLVDYKLNEHGFKHQFKDFQDMVISIAKLDFSYRMYVENSNTIFDHTATAMNMLCEELEHYAMPKIFMESVLENTIKYNPDIVLIIDHTGKIQVASVSSSSQSRHTSSELKDSDIRNLFATDIHYKVTEERLFQASEINLFNYKSELILVDLSVVELTHDRLVHSSYLYLIKEKRD